MSRLALALFTLLALSAACAPQDSLPPPLALRDDAGGVLRAEPCLPAGFTCVTVSRAGQPAVSWALDPGQARDLARVLRAFSR